MKIIGPILLLFIFSSNVLSTDSLVLRGRVPASIQLSKNGQFTKTSTKISLTEKQIASKTKIVVITAH